MNWKTYATVMGLVLVASAAPASRLFDDDFDREEYEEPAGATFQVFFNPDDDIWGIGFGSGTWIRDTPIFGDFLLGLFENKLEDAFYTSVGMTIRIMPHWRVAPFVGAGGSYNHSFKSNEEDDASEPTLVVQPEADDALVDQGDSYWGGHAEAGLRVWLRNRVALFEVAGRYTWTSLDRDYWLACVSTGAGF